MTLNFLSISFIFCSNICTYFIIIHLFRLTFSACKSKMKNMADSCLWVFWFLACSTRQRKMTHSSIQNNQLVQLKEKIDDYSSLNIGLTFNLLFILEESHVIRIWGIFQKKRFFSRKWKLWSLVRWLNRCPLVLLILAQS